MTAPRDGLASSDIFPTASTGVFNMLKTTTDTGDIGPMSFNKQRLPSSVPRPARRQRNNPSHLSDDSHGSFATSARSRNSIRSGRAFDGMPPPPGPQSSTTSLQTTKTAPSSYHPDIGPQPPMPAGLRSLPNGPSPAPSSQDSRAYSLSHARYPTPLSMQRSVSSLRSQATVPRLPSQTHHAYPGRVLMRSRDYRPVSPALSDYAGGVQYAPPMPVAPLPLPPGSRIPGPRPPPMSYYSEYAQPMPAHLPPRRHMAGAPPMYHQTFQSHPSQSPQPIMPPEQSYYMYHGDHRPQQNIHGFVHAPAYPPLGRPRPMLPIASTARDYAARTQSTPASSHQSSSATNSSNPTTPGDVVTGEHGVIDPAFIDPALTDLQDDGTESPYSHYPRFLKQSSDPLNDYSQPMTAHELEGSPIVSPDGFVNRIKSLLGTYEPLASTPPNYAEHHQVTSARSASSVPHDDNKDNPVELPVEPLPEPLPEPLSEPLPEPSLHPSPDGVSQINVHLGVPAVRITREMVKAVTSPSSSERDTTTVDLKNRLESDLRHEDSDDQGDSNVAIHERSSDEFVTTTSDTQRVPVPVEAASQTSTVTLTSFSHMTGMDRLDQDRPVQDESTINQRISEVPLNLPGESEQRPSVDPPQTDSAVPSNVTAARQKVAASARSKAPPTNEDKPMISSAVNFANAEPKRPSRITSASTMRSDSTSLSALASSDWAIRISLPPTSAMVKSGGWHVPTASEVLPAEFFDGPQTTLSPRQSIHSADLIPPLRITKSVEPDTARTPAEAVDLSSFIRRSFPRRQSSLFSDISGNKKNISDESVDGRPSAMGNKSTISHMPGLREESQEDMVTPYRGGSSKFKFPSVDSTMLMGAENINLREHGPCPSLSSQQRPGMSLSEIRDLPSLHFSQMDLVDRLNDALHKRSSTRPIELIRRRRDLSGIVCPSPIRPTSTESLRERYTSFFNKPLEFNVPTPLEESEFYSAEHVLQTDATKTRQDGRDAVDSRSDRANVEQQKQQSQVPPVELDSREIKPDAKKGDAKLRKVHSPSLSRPLSPEEFLGIATDAARLSVPSCSVLSERLSELLPSIKHLNLDSVVASDDAIKQTINEIHHIGDRPITTISGRSSDGLRLMAAAAEDIATNGTHESIFLPPRAHLNKDLPPLPAEHEIPMANVPVRSTTIDLTFPAAPAPAVLRAASDSRLSNDKAFYNRESTVLPVDLHQSSVLDSTLDSRPWNSDENYPWSGDRITVDMPLARPLAAKCSETTASDVSRRTGRVSALGHDSGRRQSVSSFDSSVSQLEPTGTVTADTLTQTNQALRSATKTSIARGSTMTRMRVLSPIGTIESQDGNKSIGDMSLSITVPHKPGDRYPCSALVSPLDFDLEHDTPSLISEPSSKASGGDVTSHGGDANLSRKQSGLLSLKKRISDIPMPRKARIGPVILVQRPDSETGRPISDMSNPYSPGLSRVVSPESQHRVSRFTVASPDADSPDAMFMSSLNDCESHLGTAFGMTSNAMGKVEFGVKSLGERLRMLFIKGSELIRTLSGRGRKERQIKRQREREQWLDDSVYS